MPATTSHATAEHPTEGFRLVVLPAAPNRPVRAYLPTDYQPTYAYPLVVVFHANGECEEQAVRLVPLLSRRNYVALCLRGPVALGPRLDGRPAFGWGEKPDRGVAAALAHALTAYSVHPGRIYLVGVGEGAAAAYRFALSKRGRVAGVVALNGALPVGRVAGNELRVLIDHGSTNPVTPFAEARRGAARLSASGATVRLARHTTSQRIHPEMLRDANRWIMTQVISSKLTGE